MPRRLAPLLLLVPLLLASGCCWWDDDYYYCDGCGYWYCDDCGGDWYTPWVIINAGGGGGGGGAGWPPPSTPLLEQFWYTSFDTAGGADEDWFRLVVDDDYVHVLVDFVDALGDIDVALYDDQGNELARATSSTDNETLVYGPVPAGTYYVVVYGYGLWVGPNPYDIWWDDLPGGTPLRSAPPPAFNG